MPIIIATALGFLKRIPWWAFATVALGAALWWLIADDRHYRTKAAELTTTLSQVKDAQAKATIAAQAAHDAQEQRYKDLANAADKDHAAALADAGAATDSYIRTHRLPACPASRAAGSPIASASGDSASVPASLPTDAVMVSASDVQACSGAVTYAISARDWAESLNP